MALLQEQGWSRIEGGYGVSKGSWQVHMDTSSWLVITTDQNKRVFDVHVPSDYEAAWTLNLIEYVCQLDDERFRLRRALEEVGSQAADAALQDCFHSWLVEDSSTLKCSVCGRTKSSEAV